MYSILKNIRLSIRKKYAKTKRKSCLKYDLEYDICLYFEYILNLEGHTLKNSFMSDFTLYLAIASWQVSKMSSQASSNGSPEELTQHSSGKKPCSSWT